MKKFDTSKTQQQLGITMQSAKSGFTLIELSIVLVIIGLIVGGVLVGQDLIKAAEIRATVGQIEKYNAAANTFYSKYNGLPGDLANANTNFGFTATAPTTANNDGLINSTTATNGLLYSGERAAFFLHLAQASLIADSVTATTSVAAAGAIATFGPTYAPVAKVGAGAYILAGSILSAQAAPDNTNWYMPRNYNYFFINAPLSADADSLLTAYNPLTPTQAYQIDSKLDDGVPTTGVVIAYDNDNTGNTNVVGTGAPFTTTTTGHKLTTAGASLCRSAATVYNIASAGTTQLCSLAIRTAF